jgi:hypothetical protein
MAMKIKIACKVGMVRWKELKADPRPLKIRSLLDVERMKQSVIDNGIIDVIAVHGETQKIIDGECLVKALALLESEGVEVPEEIPAVIAEGEYETLVLFYESANHVLTQKDLIDFAGERDVSHMLFPNGEFFLLFNPIDIDRYFRMVVGKKVYVAAETGGGLFDEGDVK